MEPKLPATEPGRDGPEEICQLCGKSTHQHRTEVPCKTRTLPIVPSAWVLQVEWDSSYYWLNIIDLCMVWS